MDPVLTAAVGLLIVLAIWRLRHTHRLTRQNKSAEIEKKLAALRKKRDEE